jgi:DNA-binding XRE family transcriptional regulator
MKSEIFLAGEFWTAFIRDLRAARAHIIIQSAFIASRRLKSLAGDIREITSRGVVICVFLQQPRSWMQLPVDLDPQAAYTLNEFKLAVDMLRSWDVNLKEKIHGKLAVLDQNVLWEGSLNILSHFNTEEHMRRWEYSNEVNRIVNKHALLECSDCAMNRQICGTTSMRSERLVVLGKSLAKHRIIAEPSQRAFAHKHGLSQNTVSVIEAGMNVTLRRLFQYTDQLDVEGIFLPKLLIPAVTQFVRQLTDVSEN